MTVLLLLLLLLLLFLILHLLLLLFCCCCCFVVVVVVVLSVVVVCMHVNKYLCSNRSHMLINNSDFLQKMVWCVFLEMVLGITLKMYSVYFGVASNIGPFLIICVL